MKLNLNSVRLGPESFTEALAHDGPRCASCDGPNDRAHQRQRYCRQCHREYQAQHRRDEREMVRAYRHGRPVVSRATNDAFSEAS